MGTQRRYHRVRAKGVAGHVKTGDRVGSYAIENISAGGLFIRTATPMPIGFAVVVDLVKPGLKRPLQLSGRVVTVVPLSEAQKKGIVPGVGIELDPMTPDVDTRLKALVAELAEHDRDEEGEPEQLVANVRGLLEMLSAAQQEIKVRDDEILSLRAEVKRLREAARGKH
jgi:Tfp pilus assembly protein PilZ